MVCRAYYQSTISALEEHQKGVCWLAHAGFPPRIAAVAPAAALTQREREREWTLTFFRGAARLSRWGEGKAECCTRIPLH